MRQVLIAATAACGLVLSACGSGGDGGSDASTIGDWRAEHATDVSGLNLSLSAAILSVDAGNREAMQGDCRQLAESTAALREDALPVPDQTVDTALRDALDAVDAGAVACQEGARTTDADDVEAAMDLLDEAGIALDAAIAAIGG